MLLLAALWGAAPQGCGTDLRRQAQRPCGMQRDAECRAETALTDNWSLELSYYINEMVLTNKQSR